MVAAYKDGRASFSLVDKGCVYNLQPFFIDVSVSPAYDRDIEEDIIADTSGHFKKMLIVLLQVRYQQLFIQSSKQTLFIKR